MPTSGGRFIIGGSGSLIRIEIDESQIQGLKQPRVGAQMGREGLQVASESIAERIAEIARERLSPGHEKNIGTTGQAAQNIQVRKTSDGAEIFEGPYPANFFIREGRAEGSRRPPNWAIVDWLSHSKFSITPPESARKQVRWTQRGGARARSRTKPPRPFKRDLKEIAGYIANAISEKGMTTLMDDYPTGQPRYDYYGEILSRSPGMEHFRRIGTEIMDKTWFPIFARFVRDGRYRRIPVRPIAGGA